MQRTQIGFRGLLAFALVLPAVAVAQVETKQYEDGSVYEGTFKGGLQHGMGTLTPAVGL